MQIECIGNGTDVFEAGLEVIGAGGGTSGPSIAVVDAFSGNTYTVGDTVLLQWSASADAAGGGVVIEISSDGGETWASLTDNSIARSHPYWGAYPVVLAPTIRDVRIASNQVRFRVSDYFDPAVHALTGTFTVAEQATVLGAAHATVGGAQQISVRNGWCSARIRGSDPCTVSLFSLDGRRLFSRTVQGATALSFPLPPRAGTVLVRIEHGARTITQRHILKAD
jgi:hypothetical protein